MAELLLGIDVGTYSSKGVLVTPTGEVLKQHVVQHGMDVPRAGWAEQDADAVWWSDFVSISRILLDGSPYKGTDVAGVAVSAIGPCLLPLDAKGRPLRKGILYGVDTRARNEISELNDRLGADEIFRFSGMALTSQAVGPKILWLQKNEPEVWSATRTLTTASSYLVYRLTGEHVMDRHTASHYLPLMDIRTLEWSERFEAEIAPLAMLPRLGWSDERAGAVTAAAAKETGLAVGTPVATGAVDALSEAISVGVTAPGDLMIMYGSTTFFILVLDEPVADSRVWSVAGSFEGQYNLAAGMATTGSLTRWIRDQFARELTDDQAYDLLFEGAKRVPPGSNGLLLLPYFSGERTPINDPDARGVVAGLSLAHTRDHLFRAALEGVAYGIRDNFEAFQDMGASIKRVVAVGGGTTSDAWLQIVSDVTGLPQVVMRQSVGASYGDAFLAGLSSGTLRRKDLEAWIQKAQVVEPNQDTKTTYDDGFESFKQLYRDTTAVVHRLSRS